MPPARLSTQNQLIEWNGTIGNRQAGHVYPIRAARRDGRVIYDASRQRKIAPLPARTICSGHVFHIQQSIERRDCMVMHLTFVEADRAGKRWRLREAGLFPLRPEPTRGGRFITYTPPRPVGPAPPERHPSLLRSGAPPRPMPNKTRWPGEARAEGWTVPVRLALLLSTFVERFCRGSSQTARVSLLARRRRCTLRHA